MVIGEAVATVVGKRTPQVGPVTTGPSFASMLDAEIDPGWRTEMASKGNAEIARNPAFQRAVQQFATDATAQRGFAIAIGTLSTGRFTAAGMRANLAAPIDPATRATRDPQATASVVRGFDAGVAAFKGAASGLVQGPASPSSSSSSGGVPRVAIIGGAALVVGAIAFFALRK